MTKNELSQYIDLIREIGDLQNRIASLAADCTVIDKVQASDSEFPYTQGSVTIRGIQESEEDRDQRLQMQALLAARQERARDMVFRIERFIDSVPDSRLRQVFQLKYMDRWTWEEIGDLLGYDGSTVAKWVDSYLKQNSKNSKKKCANM